jgi:hypothetical protein
MVHAQKKRYSEKGRKQSMLNNIYRWSNDTKKYYKYFPPEEWTIVLFTDNMELKINCCNCGKEIRFGAAYTSQEYHTKSGMGYPVCEACSQAESDRRRKKKP